MNQMYGQSNPQMQSNPYMMGRPMTGMIQNGINWVQGIEGAKAFQLIPNGNAMMLDSENDGVFYIKTSDNVGMCNLRIFKYTEVTEQQNQKINPDEYVKKSELESLINQMLGGNSSEQTIQSTQSSKPTITQ